MRILKFNESNSDKFYIDDVKDYFLDFIESGIVENFNIKINHEYLDTPLTEASNILKIFYNFSIGNRKYTDTIEYDETYTYKIIKKLDGLKNVIPNLHIYENGHFNVFSIRREINIEKYINYMNDILSKITSCRVKNSFLDRMTFQIEEDKWGKFQEEIKLSGIEDNFVITKNSPFFGKNGDKKLDYQGYDVTLIDKSPRVKNIRYSIDPELYPDPLEFILSMQTT